MNFSEGSCQPGKYPCIEIQYRFKSDANWLIAMAGGCPPGVKACPFDSTNTDTITLP